MTEQEYLDVAAAILDGTPVSWDTLPEPVTDGDRGCLQQLRLLADLRRIHRDAHSPVGTTWGHLLVVEPLGIGTFGDVYKARDTVLDRDVALKLLRSATAGRHVSEGRALARVRHPNVVTVFGAAEHDGRCGIWMELVQGETLAQLVAREGPLEAGLATAIGLDICRALGAVHASGLLHGDIKAQNVMREAGRIALMDFGTGRVADDATAEMMAGTPLYIAPEVLNGDPISAASDIYGVGVLLYFLLTGTFPVTGRTLADVRAAHADGLRTPVRARRQDIPQRLAAVIDRATAPAVATRIRSAAELEAALVQPNTAGARVGGRAHWWAAAVMAMTVSAIGGGALAVRSAGGGWPFGPPGIAATQNADLRGPARSPSRAVRLVWTGQDAFGSVRGTISPDGRYLTFVDLATNGLGIRDLFENTSRVLAQGPDSSLFYAVFSPDGQRVAYTWRTWSGGKNEFDVRVLSLNGGDAAKPRVVYKNAEMRWPRVFGWTPDGKQILLLRSLQDGTNQITFVGVDDGSARVLKSIAWNYTTMSLSPDGRFVAYDSVVGNGTSPQEIFVLATDGSRETKVVQGPGVNRSPLWAPDGSRLLFLSTRTGNTALWSVSIQEGKAAGSPELIKADIGDVRLQGITRHGTLHYLVSGASRANVYVAEMDDARKSFLTPAVVSERFINSNSAPAWSPDGRQLAYLSRTPAATALVVRTLATGEERDIALPKEVQTGNLVPAPRWFPDGRSVLVCGFLGNGAGRFYRVDVASGSAEVLHEAKGTSGDGGLGATAIARDGNAFWYIASHAESRGLIRFDIESRRTTVVKSGPFDAVALSADGTQFALATVEADGCHVRVMPSAGGELKDLVRVCSGVNRLGWASNSDVMYVTGGNASPNIVWRVSTNGGEPRQVGISMPAQLMHPEVSPDGRRIAFNIFDTSASEVWALENFLPPLNAKK